MEPTEYTTDFQRDQSSQSPDHNEQDQTLIRTLWIYASPIILVMGTIGNILSVLVMMRKSLRSHTTSLYLIVLAVVDTSLLYTGLLRHWVSALTDLDFRNFSRVGCKFSLFSVYVLRELEPWIIVAVTAERLAAIFIPLKAKSIFTKKFASIQLVIASLIAIGLNAHFFWTYTINDGGICTIDQNYLDFFVFTWGWIDSSLASLIPFILMIGSNVAIITKLALLEKTRAKQLNNKDSPKMTSMTAILLTISFAFFLTTAPLSIFLSTQGIWFARAKTQADLARMELVWTIVNILSYTNYAINFLLYCLSGPRFRAELVRMLSRNKVAPILTGSS